MLEGVVLEPIRNIEIQTENRIVEIKRGELITCGDFKIDDNGEIWVEVVGKDCYSTLNNLITHSEKIELTEREIINWFKQ